MGKICKKSLVFRISEGKEMDKKETKEKEKIERTVNLPIVMRKTLGESEKLTEECGLVSHDGGLSAGSASCN